MQNNPSPNTRSAFQEKLSILKTEFWSRIPEKIAVIEGFFRDASSRPLNATVHPEFIRYVHSFVGAAGCMGFHELSRKAKELEQHLASGPDKERDRKAFDDRVWSHIFTLKQMSRTTSGPAAPTADSCNGRPSPLPTPKLKALVASDDLYAREFLATELLADGHQVITVENGAQAVAASAAENPDLILLDVVMPQMDGFEAARRIKQDQGDKFTPVIFVTSHSDRNNLLKCIECGGDDYVLKPFDPQILKAKIFALDRIRRGQRAARVSG